MYPPLGLRSLPQPVARQRQRSVRQSQGAHCCPSARNVTTSPSSTEPARSAGIATNPSPGSRVGCMLPAVTNPSKTGWPNTCPITIATTKSRTLTPKSRSPPVPYSFALIYIFIYKAFIASVLSQKTKSDGALFQYFAGPDSIVSVPERSK